MATRRPQPEPYALPDAITADYVRTLRAWVREAYNAGLPTIESRYAAALATREDRREDAEPVDAIMQGVRLEYAATRTDDEIRRLLDRIGKSVQDYNGREHQLRFRVLAVDPIDADPWLDPVMTSWGEANASLIRRLPADLEADIARGVQDAWRRGESLDDLRKRLADREGITERRARLIARDQVNKLNGQLHGVRQVAAGVTEYRWSTSMDERVRQRHADRHADVFSWSEPPSDGHPGQPIQCRCTPDPVLDDLLTEEGLLGLGTAGDDLDAVAARTHSRLVEATEALAEPAQDESPGIVSQLLAAVPAAAEILGALMLYYSREAVPGEGEG